MMYLHIDISYKKDNNKAQQITQHKRFVAKGEKMVIRNIKFLLLFCIAVTLLIFCVACSQEGKAKRKFVSIIEKEFEALKTEEVERKEQPKCQLINADDPFGRTFGLPLLPPPPGMEVRLKGNEYWADYREYIKYEYNIKKTDSIVTPFLGHVSFMYDIIIKRGSTMQECIDSEWKPYKPLSAEELASLAKKYDFVDPEGLSGFSHDYAYQDGKWVLKKTTLDEKIKPVKE